MWRQVRGNLVLLSFAVILVGLSSVDAYYDQFGLRNEVSIFSPEEILYRGIVAVFYLPWLGAVYVGLLLSLVALPAIVRHFGRGLARAAGVHLGVVICLALCWVLGEAAGASSAFADMKQSGSRLPVIAALAADDATGAKVTTHDGERLLLQNELGLYSFTPVGNPETERPSVIFRSKEAVHEITTCMSC
jgi:hypothetical protein